MLLKKLENALLLVFFILVSSVLGHAASKSPEQAKAKQSPQQHHPAHLSWIACRKDAKHLVKLLELSHPDPYTPMGGKVAFKRKARMLFQSLPNKGMTVEAFSEYLQSYLAGLNDGHTRLQLKNLSWKAPKDTIPVIFEVSDQGLHLVGFDLSALDGTQGFILSRVNGIPIAELEARLSHFMPFENSYHGHAMLKRAIVSLSLLGHLLPHFDPRQGITYELVSSGGVRTLRKIPLSKVSNKKQEEWRTPPPRWNHLTFSEEPFYFKIFKDESIAYFKVATVTNREAFEMAFNYNMGNPKSWLEWYYKENKRHMPEDLKQAILGVPSFLDPAEKLLKEMKRLSTKYLIVDLRGNGGGMTPTVIPFLYMMFGDGYYRHRFPGEFITVLSQLYLDKYKTTLEAQKQKRNDPTLELGDYLFDKEKHEDAQTKRKRQIAEYKQKKLSFAAKLEHLQGMPIYSPPAIVVLCDADTYSAAFHFMFYLRDLGAKVVGIPSSQAPNTPMEMTEFTLPESKLQGSISNSAQVFLPNDPQAKVLLPDFPLSYELMQRYHFEENTALHYIFDLIKEGKISAGSVKKNQSQHSLSRGK